MGLIAEVLEFFRGTDGDAEVAYTKGDLGGNDVVTPQHYQGAGVDSQPLPGDYMLVVPGPEAGTFVVAGYLDPNNAGVTEKGETRLYARDGDGNITGSVMLKTDGTVHLGEDTAAALIARADRTDAELAKIKDAHNDHTHKHEDVLDTGVIANKLTSKPTSSITGSPLAFQYEPEPTGADKGWVT